MIEQVTAYDEKFVKVYNDFTAVKENIFVLLPL
jgi:hypothetical protein